MLYKRNCLILIFFLKAADGSSKTLCSMEPLNLVIYYSKTIYVLESLLKIWLSIIYYRIDDWFNVEGYGTLRQVAKLEAATGATRR